MRNHTFIIMVTLFFVLVFPPLVIEPSGGQISSSPLMLNYDLSFGGEVPLNITFNTSSYTFEPPNFHQIIEVSIEHPDEINSEVILYLENQTLSGKDSDLVSTGLGDPHLADEFGFIGDINAFIGMDDAHLYEYGVDIFVEEASVIHISSGEIEVVDVILESENMTSEIRYEVNTGIMLFGVRDGFDYHIEFNLNVVNGDFHWFDQFYNFTSSSPSSGSPNDEIALIFLVIIIGVILFIAYRNSSQKSSSNPPKSKRTNIPKSTDTSRKSEDFIKVAGYPREVRICCYQTARLDELYCPCGRATSDELRNFFKD